MPNVTLHAVNLVNPTHMEWSPGGLLLVSEYTAGRLKEISTGGDQLNTDPFAFGLQGPASILPTDDGKILVAENWNGKVAEVSGGGDVSQRTPYISGRSNPYSLSQYIKKNQKRIYLSEHYNGRNSWITDITDAANPFEYVSNIPARPGAAAMVPWGQFYEWQKFASAGCTINWQGGGDSAHYLAIGGMGQILDVYDAGGGSTSI